MSAALREAAPLSLRGVGHKAASLSVPCVCGSDHLCACGCGQEINTDVRRIHELIAAGARPGRVAAILGVSYAHVKQLRKSPPRYLKGHYRLDAEQRDRMLQVQAARSSSRKRTDDAAIIRYCWQKIADGDVRWAYRTRGGIASVFGQVHPEFLAEIRADLRSVGTRGTSRIWRKTHPLRSERPVGSTSAELKVHATEFLRISERERLAAVRDMEREFTAAERQAERAATRDLVRATCSAEKKRLAAERAAARVLARIDDPARAMKSARWWSEKPEAKRPVSLDAPLTRDGDSSERYEVALLPVMASAEDEVMADISASTLRQIVGDMTPEDVQRMTTWDLDRLRARLADAGLVPHGVQDAERERLRPENRHAGGSVPKMGRKHGGKRTRAQQSQVTRDHHVREMDNARKKAHKAMRRLRNEARA